MPGVNCCSIGATAASDEVTTGATAVIRRFEELTQKAAEVQEVVLRDILQQNGSCEYLRDICGLDLLCQEGDVVSVYKQHVPLVTHLDILPYIRRIVDGDRSSILTASPVKAMSLSSGTTDLHQKYLPYFEGLRNGTLEVGRIATAYRERVYPVSQGARILEFMYCGRFSTTKGGLQVGTASTHLVRSDAYKLRQKQNNLKSCSPESVTFGSDCRQAMYCHLLCGLLHTHDLEIVSAVFAYTLVEAFQKLACEWEHLCYDIRHGSLSSSRITDPSLREAILTSKLTEPNPVLAASLETRFSALQSQDWYGLIPNIWPHCKYVLSINTGTMETYVGRLRHYAGPGVPLVSADYGATEGWIAVNICPAAVPSEVSFTAVPSLAFFEFIPLREPMKAGFTLNGGPPSISRLEEGDPVGLTEVEVGEQYEVVMTTSGGLYRYRLGDVVKVTGFFNQSPQFKYIYRKNVLLSINIDKNTEKDLHMVVSKAAAKLGEASVHTVQMIDYTSYAEHNPAHYVIFWEINMPAHHQLLHAGATKAWLDECAFIMDTSFVDPGYIVSRKMETIRPLELRLVQRGTFSKVLDRYMALQGAAITQYKTPRCIVSSDVLSLLRANTSSTHFSRAVF